MLIVRFGMSCAMCRPVGMPLQGVAAGIGSKNEKRCGDEAVKAPHPLLDMQRLYAGR